MQWRNGCRKRVYRSESGGLSVKKSITKKKLAVVPIGGIMTMGMSGQMTEAARAQENPFGLVYQNAITKNGK